MSADPSLTVEFLDEHKHLNDELRTLVTRMAQLSASMIPHRLVLRFDLVNSQLGIWIALERKRRGFWQAVRPETFLPFVASTSALAGLFLYVGEHGRLPDSPTEHPGA